MAPIYANEPWYALLKAAVAAAGKRGVQGVSDRLKAAGCKGVDRSTLSLVLSGNYPADTARIAAKVLKVLGGHPCPYLGFDIDDAQCREANTGPMPTWDPAAMEQRRACESCAHKPFSPTQQGEKA